MARGMIPPSRPDDRLKTLSRSDRRRFHNVVKEEVPLVERIIRSAKLNRPATVLLEELRSQFGSR
jgi:hypothetical protein